MASERIGRVDIEVPKLGLAARHGRCPRDSHADSSRERGRAQARAQGGAAAPFLRSAFPAAGSAHGDVTASK